MNKHKNIWKFWPIAAFALIVLSALTAPFWVLDTTTQCNSQSSQRVLKKGPYSTELSVNDELNSERKQRAVTFWLGTDILGRDIFSRMMYGIRMSLFIGFWSVVVSLLIGGTLGLMGGYFGSWIDRVLLLIMNSLWSIPTILLVFALVLAFGRGISNIIWAIGLTMWVDIARLVRGQTIQLKEIQFIKATSSLGFSSGRTMLQHVLPNIIEPVIVLATVNFATAILVEAGISYLGLGIQPPTPSLGQILADHYSYVLGGHYAKSIVPAVVIFIIVLMLNLSGTVLRDQLESKKLNVSA